MAELASRERMQRALGVQDVDHIPCCFMSFAALRRRWGDDAYKVVQAELDMGLDSMLFIPAAPRSQRPHHPDLRGLPVRPAPEVQVREWREVVPGGSDLLHKEYHTPAGTLTTSVSLSDDWPHGDHIPFVDDFQIPRTRKPLITGEADLEALRYLLRAPTEDDIASFQQETRQATAFAREKGVLLAGGWGVGMDMASWLCGLQDLMVMQRTQPALVAGLLEIIHRWTLQRMEVVLAAPVDLYIRRAWYEGCDFVLRGFYRQAILPRLKAEVNLAHERGAKFGLICTSGTRPLLDDYLEAGIDALIGVDPVQGTYTDLALLKERLGGRVCLWGGVSAAVTVELGDEKEVRAAVRDAIRGLGPTGLVLSPIDNITVDTPRSWRNVEILIDEWQKCR
jgi:uroporphyrinogen-III decarboxylase